MSAYRPPSLPPRLISGACAIQPGRKPPTPRFDEHQHREAAMAYKIIRDGDGRATGTNKTRRGSTFL